MDDINLDTGDDQGNFSKSWLPDFGEPALRTRDRSDYHEAAAAHHYSDHEDETQHRRKDSFAHHQPATKFAFREEFEKKKVRKKKKKKNGKGENDESAAKRISPLKQSISDLGGRHESINEADEETGISRNISDEPIAPRKIVVDEIVPDPNQFQPARVDDKESELHHIQQHRIRKHKRSKRLEDDLESRRRTGDQIELKTQSCNLKIGSEDAKILTQADMDEAISHRLDDVPGIRKHIIHRPVKRRVKFNPSYKADTVSQVSEKAGDRRSSQQKQPHEVFVELDELVMGKDNELVWKEKARWIKFEEDVEENEVWSKPHIASLSFLSLWEVRKGMEKGLCLLDIKSETLPGIAGEVVTAMAMENLIRPGDRLPIMNALLLKHRSDHIKDGVNDWSHFLDDLHRPTDGESDCEGPSKDQLKVLYDHEKLKQESDAILTRRQSLRNPDEKRPKIMNRIPDDAEATIVLVGKVDFLEAPVMAFVRLAEARDLGDVLSLPIPVRFIFILLGPDDLTGHFDYHEVGRSLSTLMANVDFHNSAYLASSKRDLLRSIKTFLDDSIVLPPGQLEDQKLLQSIESFQKQLLRRKLVAEMKIIKQNKEKARDPLARTGKFFGAMVEDMKRRYTVYLSDLRDGLNGQCLAASIFLFFAILSPAITFGGLLEEKTDKWMGVSETLVGSALGGIISALLLGQPLLVLGMTGPNVVFEEALYNFCSSNELNFMATRVWVGFWILLISVLFAMFELSWLISKVSRFTEEIFSILISLIFIIETFKKLAKTFDKHPVMSLEEYLEGCFHATDEINENDSSLLVEEFLIAPTAAPENESFVGNFYNGSHIGYVFDAKDKCAYHPNMALLTMILMFGTFLLAFALRKFRASTFLSSKVRRTIGDFGVPIAILVMVCAQLGTTDVHLQKLNVPDAIANGINPTDSSKRGWLIHPMGTADFPLKTWAIGVALPFAILCFILLFIESQVAEMIISGQDRKLKKGVSYHLNMLVIGILNGFLSLFGCPWICAASVRTLTHLNAVTISSTNHAPGDKPKIVGAHEQRLTGLVSSILLALSVLLGRILKHVPVSVLFGIFLYMGVTSLNGLQLYDRIILMFMPSKHHPDFRYVRKVRPLRVHLFTLIQVVCLGILWAVKSTPAAIGFPFFLVLCVPTRIYLLPLIFTKKELLEIDNETLDDLYDDHDDAYRESHAVPNRLNHESHED